MLTLATFLDAGLTTRQVNYWTACGYLEVEPRPVGSGSGIPRSWRDGELTVALRIKALIDAGLSVRHAVQLARSGPGDYEVAPGVRVNFSEIDVPEQPTVPSEEVVAS